MRQEFSYRKTGAVYTRQFGLVEVTPDRKPTRPRARIGSNSMANSVLKTVDNRSEHWYKRGVRNVSKM